MSITTMNKNINQFFAEFIDGISNDENVDLDFLKDSWNSKENQKVLKKILQSEEKSDNLKDPNKPKQPKSAYLFFCQDNREQVKKDNPDVKPQEITKILATRWKEFKDNSVNEQKLEEYQALANQDKKRYEKEMEEYIPPSQGELQKLKKPKKIKSNKPKNPKTAYHYFCDRYRKDVTNKLKEVEGNEFNSKHVMTELGRLWKEFKNDSAKENELQELEQLSQNDRNRYKEEVKNFYLSQSSDEENISASD